MGKQKHEVCYVALESTHPQYSSGRTKCCHISLILKFTCTKTRNWLILHWIIEK